MAEDRRTDRERPKLETSEPEFAEIEKRREFDREEHARRAEEAGVPKDKAREHADEDVQDGARVEGKP